MTQDGKQQPGQDWFLESLVKLVNDAKGSHMGITLHVSGLVVSGQLASGAEYFEAVGEAFDRALSSETKKTTLADTFKKVAEKLYSQDTSPSPGYLHIRNARFFHPSGGPLQPSSQVWWRGRLSEVSGFILGEITSTETG